MLTSWTGATSACDPRYWASGVVFGVEARAGGPCQNHPTVRPRAYMYRRSRRSTLYVQRCTIKPSSSWQDARRKTPNDLFPVSLSLSLPLILLRVSPPPVYSVCFTVAAPSDSTFCLFYFSPRPLSALTSKLRERLDVARLCNCLPVA